MELQIISAEDFKLIKSFYPDFKRAKGIESNEYAIDWNGLMPVVEKIKPLAYTIDIDSTAWRRVSGHSIFAKIEDVYNSVVEFIKWYNLQPKTEDILDTGTRLPEQKEESIGKVKEENQELQKVLFNELFDLYDANKGAIEIMSKFGIYRKP